MAALENLKREAFAQARAAGASVARASLAAGYAPSHGNGWRIARDEKVKARVAELERAAVGASRDLAPVIAEMLRLSKEAAKLDSAAGMREAKDFLVQAARLKGLLPRAPVPIEPEMTMAEWLAEYAPAK